jgi:hypothetical protein
MVVGLHGQIDSKNAEIGVIRPAGARNIDLIGVSQKAPAGAVGRLAVLSE